MPTALADHTPATQVPKPTACLLHGDFHVMGHDCWDTTMQWYFDRTHLAGAEQRDAYQAAVERKMLDDLVRVPA